MKEYSVSAIKEGTVIDHIPADVAFKVAELLHLDQVKGSVTVASNLKSKRHGKKGIIKVEKKELTKDETNKIALFAPQATINIIKDYEVKEKRKVALPEMLVNLVSCRNPNCITNREKVVTAFHVLQKAPLELACHHCERIFTQADVVLL